MPIFAFSSNELKMTRAIAYLRVSVASGDNEKNKTDILAFAMDLGLAKVEFVEEKVSGSKPWNERKIFGILNELKKGEVLIVSEFSRLGRSMLEIMDILNVAVQKGVRMYAVKGAWKLDDTIQSKIVAMVFAMAAEIERGLIIQRTREALSAAKASGTKLGRPKGPGKSKLDKHGPEIRAFIANGSTQRFIAKRYGVTEATLSNWLKQNRKAKDKDEQVPSFFDQAVN